MSVQPQVTGARHMISAGHYLATQAGFDVLEAGGNAVDAGVAAGIALGVVQPDIVQFGGVAPIMIRIADTGEVVTIAGLGHWPKRATLDRFIVDHGSTIPRGVERTVVPAAPDAWITALDGWGTMSFSDVSAASVRYAADGFTVHRHLAATVSAYADAYREWPTNAALFLPNNAPPEVGSLFVQPDLAATIEHMADCERAASGSRSAGLAAARDAFYSGDIAATMVAFQVEHGGLVDADDLADYRSEVAPALTRPFGDLDVYACGPWCQGPALLQMLGVLDGSGVADLAANGHNNADYLHLVIEAMKLAFADREAYYGDPRFVDVPLDVLLSAPYGAGRRSLIAADEAFDGLPPPGLVADRVSSGVGADSAVPVGGEAVDDRVEPDTSYVCVVDRFGNAFSATPSDATYGVPIVPGLGFAMSGRGSQSYVDPDHPASIAPGKRPRLTPNPALAVGDHGAMVMPFGTPGGDSQCQAMLQYLLNVSLFGMSPQDAVEAPRVLTHSHPSSFEPHRAWPGRVDVEDRIDHAVRQRLGELGHDVRVRTSFDPGAGAVCAIVAETDTHSATPRRVLWGAADPRRPARAMGW